MKRDASELDDTFAPMALTVDDLTAVAGATGATKDQRSTPPVTIGDLEKRGLLF